MILWHFVVIFFAAFSSGLGVAGSSQRPTNRNKGPERANDTFLKEVSNDSTKSHYNSSDRFKERSFARGSTSRSFKDYQDKSTCSTRSTDRGDNDIFKKISSQSHGQSRTGDESQRNQSEKQRVRKGIQPAKNIFRGNQPASWTLVYTAIVVRHGTRDAGKVVSFVKDRSWSRGSDTLTEAGIAGIRRLGRRLKNQYASLIGNAKPSDIRAFSTIFGRTMQTARLLLEELYGQNSEDIDIINFNSRWNGGTMERYYEALAAYDDTTFRDYEKKVFNQLYTKVVPYIRDFSIDKVPHFIDTMLCEEANGVVHPQVIKDEMVSLYRYKYWKFTRDHYNTLMKQVIAAPYISEILSSIKRVEAGISRGVPKFEIFSSHDNYIQTIMRALDAISPFHRYFKTDFGCGILFELYRYEKAKLNPSNGARSYGYIVKIFYNYDTSLNFVEAVPMRGCQNNYFDGEKQKQPFCFLHQFEYAMRDYAMDKYEYMGLCSGQKCTNQNDYDRILAEVRDKIKRGSAAAVVPNSFSSDRPIKRR